MKNFNPRAPRGARLNNAKYYASNVVFQSTRPARGATKTDLQLNQNSAISIHAPREGRDRRQQSPLSELRYFNPRAPRGARRSGRCRGWSSNSLFQSTRPARGATPQQKAAPPRTLFQSTRPARGATGKGKEQQNVQHNFNPRAPRGARQRIYRNPQQYKTFQSTRPARGATRSFGSKSKNKEFQSTRPARGATEAYFENYRGDEDISIHAPREGRDRARLLWALHGRLISIHAPREGRDTGNTRNISGRFAFQSTRPARGATEKEFRKGEYQGFQSTRPARGATIAVFIQRSPPKFQSTRPARGATVGYGVDGTYDKISIHAPREGRDWIVRPPEQIINNFNPRAPRGARHVTVVIKTRTTNFNPRAPRGARPKL